jgi:uncharacterized protein (TIRG00374 family)
VSDKVKRALWLVVRLAVMAALVAYVVSQADLYDAVRLAPGEKPLRILRDTPLGPVVRDTDGGERLVLCEDIKPGGAFRLDGILTIGRRLADHWGWAVAAAAVMMLQSPLGGIRWKLLLGVQDIHITLAESVRLTWIGWFFNNWLPGATGGDIIKAWYIARQTRHKPEAVTVVFLDRLIGLIAMCMMGAAAVAVSFSDARVRAAQIIVGVFLAGVTLAAVVFYSRLLRRALRVDRLLAVLPLRDTVEKVDRTLFVYRYHKAKVALSVAYSWGAQVVSVLAMWWLATGLGSLAAWYHYFVNMPVIWIGWSVVPVPGGVGVAETLTQKLFSPQVLGGAAPPPAAEAATLALAMILAYRLVQLVVSLPGGVLYLMRRTDVSPRQMRDAMAKDNAK